MAKYKRVLFVCRNYMPGGIRSSLMSLVNSINKKYELSIVILSEDVSKGDIDYLTIRNVNVINPGLATNLIYTPGVFYLQNGHIFKLILKGILKISMKIVSVNGVVNRVLKGALRRISNEKYDIVISFTNDIWENGRCFPGCNYLVSIFDEVYKIGWLHAELDYLGLTYERLMDTYRNYDRVVCVSNACKKELINMCPELCDKTYVCHNLVDKDRINKLLKYNIDERFCRSDVFRIVTVARMELKSKRHDRIIEVAKKLKEANISFVWYLVGGGMDYDKINSMIIKANLSNELILTGMLENPYSYIAYADLFVLTSDTESFGIVLMESIMCSTPVITTDFSASKEVVEDGINGYIVSKDVNSIFERICFLINNPDELNRITENCKTFVNWDSSEFDNMIGSLK